MNRPRCQVALLLCAQLVLSACSNEQAESLQATQLALGEQLLQMEERLQVLETRPQLDFTLTETQTSISEKMFAPLVLASARISAQGERMPPTFYVDVMLKVKVPHIQYEAVERQIFPVVEGQGRLQMQQRLPQHGLKPDQIEVTLRPMTWYRGQTISDDRISYGTSE